MKLLQISLACIVSIVGMNAFALVQKDLSGRHMSLICRGEGFMARVYEPNLDYPHASLAVNKNQPGIMSGLLANEIVQPINDGDVMTYKGEQATLQVVGVQKSLKGFLKFEKALITVVHELDCEQRAQILPISDRM